MSEATQIYFELGDVGVKKYEKLINEECLLMKLLRTTGVVDNNELIRVRNEIYQLRQDARLVSRR